MERRFRGIRSKTAKWKFDLASRMARRPTTPERLLWSRLKDKVLGVRFYKQSLVFGYIADFYCPKALLVVETDGPCHNRRKVYDKRRDEALKRKGIDTMRFPAGAVENNLPAVVALIAERVGSRVRKS